MPHRVASYLHRNRHDAFYLRRAVPLTLQSVLGRREIYRSLKTTNRRLAAQRAVHVLAGFDIAFRKLAEMGRKKGESLRQDLVLKLDVSAETGALQSVEIDGQEHEEAFAKGMLSHVATLVGSARTTAGQASHVQSDESVSALIENYCVLRTKLPT